LTILLKMQSVLPIRFMVLVLHNGLRKVQMG
jgi:hypothetical protein